MLCVEGGSPRDSVPLLTGRCLNAVCFSHPSHRLSRFDCVFALIFNFLSHQKIHSKYKQAKSLRCNLPHLCVIISAFP